MSKCDKCPHCPEYARIAPAVKKLWNKPLRLADIAKKLGVPTSQVSDAAKFLKLPRKPYVHADGTTAIDKQRKAFALRNLGHTYVEIGRRLDVSGQAAWYLVREGRRRALIR